MGQTENTTQDFFYKNCTLALLLSRLKNNIYLFTRKKLAETLVTNKISLDTLTKELTSVKDSLKNLCDKDESQNLSYIDTLSKNWALFRKTCDLINTSIQNQSSTELKILALKKNIENFPKDADHCLGYYLSEYLEENWAPFPFMDILKILYNNHQTLQANSLLQSWIITIDELLEDLSF